MIENAMLAFLNDGGAEFVSTICGSALLLSLFGTIFGPFFRT